MLYPVDDKALVLVGNKSALLLVNVTNKNSAEARPVGKVTLLDKANSVLATLDLTAPTAAKLPTVASSKPGFTNSYSAELPDRFIVPGLQLQIRMANNQLSQDVKPRVGSANLISIKGIRVTITDSNTQASTTGTDYPDAARAVQLRAPVSASYVLRPAAYTSTTVKNLPKDGDAWSTAMRDVLHEIADLRTTDGAGGNEYFMAFVPNRSVLGYSGIATLSGRTSVIADMGAASDRSAVADTIVHEVGHNFGLQHAPCGNPSNVDPNYPYANAFLGAGTRFVVGYKADTREFIDPTGYLHDVMSYCIGQSFSDYNYKLIQEKFNPADADIAPRAKAAAVQPQESLLISGRLESGVWSLKPLKRFVGVPIGTGTGAYTARITTAAGAVITYAFEAWEVDHAAGMLHFSFSVPHPGDLARVDILRNGQLLASRAAASALKPKSSSTQAEQSPPTVTAVERDGQLQLQWENQSHPYLTVAHIGAQRTTLSFDMQGGSGKLSIAGLPAGGSYEFVLSDGMNSIRILQPR